MNEQCPLPPLPTPDWFEPVRYTVDQMRAYATAAVEAERARQEGEDFENALEAHHRAELGLRPKLPEGHHYYVAHPLARVEIRNDSAIPEDRAALAEECKARAAQWVSDELELSHASGVHFAPGSLYTITQQSHDALNAAIDRLAASTSQTSALEARNQVLSNALDELIYLVHELECKDNSCDPAIDISDLEKLTAAPKEPKP